MWVICQMNNVDVYRILLAATTLKDFFSVGLKYFTPVTTTTASASTTIAFNVKVATFMGS